VVMGKAEAGIGFTDGLRSVNGYSGREMTYIAGVDCRPSFRRWSLSVKA
jgi:hypothetical protein